MLALDVSMSLSTPVCQVLGRIPFKNHSCQQEIMPIQAFQLPHHIRILAAGQSLSYLTVIENPDKLKSVTALLQVQFTAFRSDAKTVCRDVKVKLNFAGKTTNLLSCLLLLLHYITENLAKTCASFLRKGAMFNPP